MNNEPNYKDNLAFKPAMTWQDLYTYAHNFNQSGYEDEICISTTDKTKISFWRNGKISVTNKTSDYTFMKMLIAENRTYEQMKNIIDNLYGE